MRRNIGDIYAIYLPGDGVGFMQHIENDKSQLGSNIVRIFGTVQIKDLPVDLEKIAESQVKFYAHVLLKAGETLNVWERIGRVNKVSASLPLWCQCNEEGNWSRDIVSYNWVVWQTNGERIPAVFDSKEFLEAELGDAFSPNDIRTRLTDGKYGGVYPRKPA